MNKLILLFMFIMLGCASPTGGPGLAPCQTVMGGYDKACLKQLEDKRLSDIDAYFKINPKDKKYKELTVGKQIQIGMPEELLYLSWGKPSKVNKTVTQYGTDKQCLYRSHYVYVRNGKVSSWQNRE